MLLLILLITPGFGDSHPFTGAAEITREEFATRCGPQVNYICSLSLLNLQHQILFALFLINEFHYLLNIFNIIPLPLRTQLFQIHSHPLRSSNCRRSSQETGPYSSSRACL